MTSALPASPACAAAMRSISLLLAVLLFSSFFYSQVSAQTEGAATTQTPYREAATALAKGDKLAALSYLNTALKQQPSFLPVRSAPLRTLPIAQIAVLFEELLCGNS